MILNVTNCKTIAKIYDSPYIEDWIGKYITVYSAKVKAFGETVEALRIRPKVPSMKKIFCADCGKEIIASAGKNPEELAEISKRNCGRELCLECMKRVKKEQDSKENSNDK